LEGVFNRGRRGVIWISLTFSTQGDHKHDGVHRQRNVYGTGKEAIKYRRAITALVFIQMDRAIPRPKIKVLGTPRVWTQFLSTKGMDAVDLDDYL